MGARQQRLGRGDERGRHLVSLAGAEFKGARSNAALSQRDVSSAVGMSRPQYGRIERGLSPNVSIATICKIAAVLGLDASLRFYPTADPIRDRPQVDLLERLRARCHPTLRWLTKVAFPRPGDLRAWDAVIQGFASPPGHQRVQGAVEAETRPVDVQALDRKLALKERDGGADWLILLFADTRHNRALLAGPGAALKARFPLDGRRALELLGAGVDPGANSVNLL
jgi:transcriptional regulator with XRE-family HTH domain